MSPVVIRVLARDLTRAAPWARLFFRALCHRQRQESWKSDGLTLVLRLRHSMLVANLSSGPRLTDTRHTMLSMCKLGVLS